MTNYQLTICLINKNAKRIAETIFVCSGSSLTIGDTFDSVVELKKLAKSLNVKLIGETKFINGELRACVR